MKQRTAELTNEALDWMVAVANGWKRGPDQSWIDPQWPQIRPKSEPPKPYRGGQLYQPSLEWAQAGPIIEREGITIVRVNDDYGHDAQGFCNNVRIPVWAATSGQHNTVTSTEHEHHAPMFQIDEVDVIYGPSPLIAAMRCYVAARLGNVVEVPDPLVARTGPIEEALAEPSPGF